MTGTQHAGYDILSGVPDDPSRSSRSAAPDALTSRTWLRIAEDGMCRTVKMSRHKMMNEYGVPYRDLRILDPVLPTLYPTSLFVRSKAIVINFEGLRLAVCKDHAFILSVPKDTALSQGCIPQLEAPFVQQLSARLRAAAAANRDAELTSVSSFGSVLPVGGFEADLPFELRLLEAALECCSTCLGAEVTAVELHAWPLMDEIVLKARQEELEMMRDLRSTLTKLVARVSRLKKELEDILDDEHEMAAMYLSRRGEQAEASAAAAAAASEAAAAASQSAAFSSSPQDFSRMFGGGTAAASGGGMWSATDLPALVEGEALGTDGERFTADQDAAVAEEGRDLDEAEPKNMRELWRSATLGVTQMLDSMKMLQESTGALDPRDANNVWDLSHLLDSHLLQVDALHRRLEAVLERLRGTEIFTERRLDHRRNELVALNLVVTAIMTSFAFVSMIAGIFGMNLTSHMETSHVAFLIASWGSLGTAAVAFVGILVYAISKRLLQIPDFNSAGNA